VTEEVSPEPLAALPDALSPDARLYLRPIGLAAGITAEAVLRAGGRRLAGGPFAFAASEVLVREGKAIKAAVAPLAGIEAWARGLSAPQKSRIAGLLDALSATRQGPSGAALARPLLMGIVNVTPDSFSDGGAHFDADEAVAHGRRLAAAGADILDVGGESTRPRAEPVGPKEEWRRAEPVLAGLAAAGLGVLLSIDTRHAEVMRRALAAGAHIINDVTALAGDPESLAVAAASEARVVLMHMQGDPADMNAAPVYDCVPLDVYDYLEARVAACVAAGIAPARLVVDPGIGFGKRSRHNLAIMRALALYHGLGCPVLLGASRKGLTGDLDRRREPKDRLAGSVAAAVMALDQGVQILRVHDVAETRQALDVWERLVGLAG